jgi:tetratricopeptide (TPR) repeat protein
MPALFFSSATAQTVAANQENSSDSETSEWLLVNTEHFAIISNTDADRAKLIAYKLEQYRYVFSQLAPELVAATGKPVRVLVFRDGASYSAGMPKFNVNSSIAGYFQAGKDLITINDLFNISDNVSFHEYTHVLTRADNEYPLWFTEGIAEFYETFEISGHSARIGEITASRLHLLQINDFTPMRKLLSFNGYNQVIKDSSLDTFYAEAWALTHYLMMDSERRAQLIEFLRQLDGGKPLDAAFRDSFKVDFDTMEEQLKQYISSGRFSVFTCDFDPSKFDSDIEISALTEAEKKIKLNDKSDNQLNLTLRRKAAPAKVAIIPDFTALGATIGLKMALSNRPVNLSPNDPNMAAKAKEALVQFNEGNLLNDKGQFDAALAKFEKALKLDPEFAPAYMHIGNIYAQMKNYEMAQLAFEKARAVAPNYAGTYLNFAVMQYEQGRSTDAEASFRIALSLYPSSAASHLGLGNIYLQRRDYARARVEYARTLSLVRGRGPEALNAYVGLGAVCFYQGEYEKAKEQYQQAIKLDPQNGAWHRAYADNCRMLKQYDQATASYNRAIELNAHDAKAQESLEWLRKISEYEHIVKQRGIK